MAWQTNQPPLEYLKRRLVYYKKKRTKIKGFLKNKEAMKRFTKKDIATATFKTNDFISKFEEAILILENNSLNAATE